VLFLGEQLAPNQVAGMGLVALALLCIDGRLFRRFQRNNHSSNR
jgi:drug/metabolite transporter (DMT)-like permease